MATDLLRAEANERVDLVDFEFLSQDSPREMARQPVAQFFTNPSGPKRAWILHGFEMSNPAGKQLVVTRGRAILGYRQGGLTYQGLLTTEGDASKSVDMAPLTPGTYNVYVRFEYVAGDSSSRIFWDPAGTGSEFAQTIPTRLKANWSIRVETASPGAEWYKIGTANNSGASLALVDERDLYFEGAVDGSFQSGWSSDGGGSGNDRNVDRQQYGVTDLQTFTAAMRQCVEDIKGRGLRRWWERDIGGLNVGFDADPVEDRVAVGDADFYLLHDGTDPRLVFDGAGSDANGAGSDAIWLDRSTDRMHVDIAGTTILEVRSSDLRVRGDIIPVVGTDSIGGVTDPWGDVYAGTIHADKLEALSSSILFAADTAPDLDSQYDFGTDTERWATGYFDDLRVSDNVFVSDSNFGLSGSATTPIFHWDNLDYVWFDRGGDEYNWVIGDTTQMWLNGSGLIVRDGLVVGTDNATTPVVDAVIVGDTDCFLKRVSAGDQRLGFDANDYLQYTSDTYRFFIGGVNEMQLGSSGLGVLGGLTVGHIGSPGSGEIQVGDADFKLDRATPSDVRLCWDASHDDRFQFSRNASVDDRQLSLYLGGNERYRFRDQYCSIGTHPRTRVTVGYIGAPTFASYDSCYAASLHVGIDGLCLYNYEYSSSFTSGLRFSETSIDGETSITVGRDSGGETMRFNTSGETVAWVNRTNFLIAWGGSLSMHLSLHGRDDDAHPGSVMSRALFYALDQTSSPWTTEMWVQDDDGNKTLLSPHDPISGEWFMNTYDTRRNKTIKVWMERLAKAVEELSGRQILQEFDGDMTRVPTPPPPEP